MSISPIERTASLRIGAVEFVSPDEIKVGLDLDAPDGIAANAGIPRAFPRINSYVLITTEAGSIVGQVEWIAIERSAFPKRKGFQDYGVIDLPFPLRKMRVNPLGILRKSQQCYSFERGVHIFPSIGEPVLIPTDEQLKAIIESGQNRRVKIGTSPLAANAEVCIDPDRLFGRHLAILGNTGSGKSCSVAGLIQWSLNAVNNSGNMNPNARFIILDPNGEYATAFGEKARVFKVGDENNPLEVPLWFWNSSEWCSFMQASTKAQVPLLKKALRYMRNEKFDIADDLNIQIKNFLKTILLSLNHDISIGSAWSDFPRPKNFFDKLSTWLTSLETFKGRITENALDLLVTSLQEYKNKRLEQYPKYNATIEEVESIHIQMMNALKAFGGTEHDLLPKNEDVPTKFNGNTFINFLEVLSQESGNEQYMEFLLARIQTMLADTKMSSIIGDNITIPLEEWLTRYIGDNEAKNGCITIIDLSLVPTEIIHVITAVISRMVFEALQRYKKANEKSLPTVLVMEEAHTFIKRYREDIETQNAASICCQIFEKIAREGRKFGLGLLLSSQRPSELSPTVLSQCNSFLLHRISNDRDQELVNRLIPDNFRGLLRELPTLPSQQAILLGWASELPILVRMNDLEKKNQPHSADPDFWNVWSGKEARAINWKAITDDWQQN
jgi:hypothetical protein